MEKETHSTSSSESFALQRTLRLLPTSGEFQKVVMQGFVQYADHFGSLEAVVAIVP